MRSAVKSFEDRRLEKLIGIPVENLYIHIYNELVISAFNFIRDYQGEFYAAELKEGENKEEVNINNRLYLSTMEALGLSSTLIEYGEFIVDGDFDFLLNGTEITKGYRYPFGLKDRSLLNIIKNYINANKIDDSEIINCAFYNYIQLFHEHINGDEVELFLSRKNALELAEQNERESLVKTLKLMDKYPDYKLIFFGNGENNYKWHVELCKFEEEKERKKPNLYLV